MAILKLINKSIRGIFLLALIALINHCYAQQEWINTDRPDQTDGTSTIKVNKFQIENGVAFSKETVLNNFMLRFGLTKSTELRLALDAGKDNGISGLMPVAFSLKQRLFDQRGALPAIAFIGDVSFGRLATGQFQSDEVPFVFTLAFDQDLSDKFSLGYNIGASERFRQLNFSFEGVYSPIVRTSFFLEYFSSFFQGNSEHNIDAGILYAITPQFQIDCATGIGLNKNAVPFFGTMGVSYLFD